MIGDASGVQPLPLAEPDTFMVYYGGGDAVSGAAVLRVTRKPSATFSARLPSPSIGQLNRRIRSSRALSELSTTSLPVLQHDNNDLREQLKTAKAESARLRKSVEVLTERVVALERRGGSETLPRFVRTPPAVLTTRLPGRCSNDRFDPKHPTIAWLHPPKSSTSFGNTLAHFAAVRPLPPNASVGHDPRAFFLRYSMFFPGIFWTPNYVGSHEQISNAAWTQYKGCFFTMMRHPTLRLHSSLHYFSIGSLSKHAEKLHVSRNFTDYEYAKRLRGTVVKMITGQAHGLDCMNHGEPNSRSQKIGGRTGGATYLNCDLAEPNAAKAVERLDGFAFVGIVEAWGLSVCLFHAMYAGECLPVEFENTRPARSMPDTFLNHTSNATEFGGYHDSYDWPLYVASVARFKKDLARFNVTPGMCEELCPNAPQWTSFDTDLDGVLKWSYQGPSAQPSVTVSQ